MTFSVKLDWSIYWNICQLDHKSVDKRSHVSFSKFGILKIGLSQVICNPCISCITHFYPSYSLRIFISHRQVGTTILQGRHSLGGDTFYYSTNIMQDIQHISVEYFPPFTIRTFYFVYKSVTGSKSSLTSSYL